MAAQPKKMKSYMKPAKKRVTIQKPEQKRKVAPSKKLSDGFTKISDSRMRKVYK